MHSMRQLPIRKPPIYQTSTKCISYRVFSIGPFANALHKQDMIRLKKSPLFRGQEELMDEETVNPVEELRKAKNKGYWSTGRQPNKRENYKATLDVSQGEGRRTRELELIWWPELFSTTSHGKLAVRFSIKRVSV